MSYRNLSPQHMFFQLALEHKPECEFKGSTKEDFASWKDATWPKVKATLADFPERVPLNPDFIVEWEQDGIRKQRWLIDVGKHISAAFVVSIPKDIKEGEKRPAILCWHGHGQFGKDSVMGNDSSPERKTEIERHNYDYGHQMSKLGYVTFAIDWIGIGERNDSSKPHFLSSNWGRDWCNLYYLHATMLGMTSVSINVTHGMAATDFACTLPFVDENRLGVMGLSGGGTMTMWSSLCDERFKATEIICYGDLWPYFGVRDTNYCGMQVTPGLLKLVNLHDLQALIAPRPLLIDIGIYDTCFPIDTTMKHYHRLEEIYKIAGASDKFEADIFAGEHGWGNNKSEAFFGKYL